MKENELKQAMQQIELSAEARQRILSKTRMAAGKRTRARGTVSFKKRFGLIAVAATFILGVTVFAASGIVTSWYGSSSSRPDYTSLPTAEQCQDDAGFTPVLLESFDNGYTFDNGSIVKNDLRDDSGNSVEKFKSFSFRYAKGGDNVIYSQQKYDTEMETEGTLMATIDGVSIYYNSYTNKLVPPDYQLTEEDKQAEANGDLVFSYGSDEVKIQTVQSVFWVADDIHSSLMQIDGGLTADELVQMAGEALAE